MHVRRRSIWSLSAALLVACGCVSPPWHRRGLPEYEGPPITAPDSPAAADAATQMPNSAGTAPASGKNDREALLAVLDQFESLGDLEPQAKQQLIDDLRRTKPSLWPAMVQQFRAALAFRQQLRQREQPAAGTANQCSTGPARSGPLTVPHTDTPPPAATNIPPTALAPTAKPIAQAARPGASTGTVAGPRSPRVSTAATPAVGTVAYAIPATPPAGLAPPNPSVPPSAAARPPVAKPQQVPPALPQTAASQTAAGASLLAGHCTAIRQVAAAAAKPIPPTTAVNGASAVNGPSAVDGASKDWASQLERAIEGLQSESRTPPRTTDEVNRQAALRILYLAAGRRQDALRPIQGISPALQDFWSKQLYGLSTYLDSSQQSDPGRRATVAKQQLSEAASRLGELGLLTVHNLAFCTEVTSFGVYKAFDRLVFSPGQEVLLYAEVDNFHSDQTDKGFRTALRSSYQILDKNGKRVDQREFSVTEDYCKNYRHDFFMRYFVRFPRQIPPGDYTLELTIEDTLANKIGQASIGFAIKSPPAGGS